MPYITREEFCSRCGKKFLYRKFLEAGEKEKRYPQILCPTCLNLKRKKAEEEKARKEREANNNKSQEEHKEFLERLKSLNVLPSAEICPDSDNVLYILGNGFDLMHRVPSSYYNFRDTLGRNNSLRYMLENFLTAEDIWSDLENAVAHFNVAAMSDECVVDMWLDINGVYEKEGGAAEYFMSVEEAANPMLTIATELPRRFRKWVETLTVGTDDRPLRSMFRNGKVLNFNYTEFVEKLYGVSKENVCYIHGCRVKEKGKPRDALILGHYLGASDGAYDVGGREKSRLRGFRRAYVETARECVLNCISEYDEILTKDTQKIIKSHESFFNDLGGVQTVIVIGHSFSRTDWDYFLKIRSSVDNSAKWYFGCYGLRDLINLEQLLPMLAIPNYGVYIFRTDGFKTTPSPITEKAVTPKNMLKVLSNSKDGKWTVGRIGSDLIVRDLNCGSVNYCLNITAGIKRAFFISNDSCLLAVIGGDGVLLLRNNGGGWSFVSELYCDHQH